jgi:hypothetical protein
VSRYAGLADVHELFATPVGRAREGVNMAQDPARPTGSRPAASGSAPPERGFDLNVHIAHPARVYDYWLGGKDNFAADRELGERTLEAYPNLVYSVRANRAFLVARCR